jgi:hypothetical protein
MHVRLPPPLRAAARLLFDPLLRAVLRRLLLAVHALRRLLLRLPAR